MKAAWLIGCCLAALFAEITAGYFGIPVPVTAAFFFYNCLVFSKLSACLPFILTAAVYDATLGRTIPFTCLLLLLVLPLAAGWKKHGDCSKLHAQILPGIVFAGETFLLRLLLGLTSGGQFSSDSMLREMITLALLFLCALAILPLSCLILDGIAQRLDLPLYKNIQNKWRNGFGRQV